jgi:hypothetical protein
MTGYDEKSLHKINLPEDPRVPVMDEVNIFNSSTLQGTLAGQTIQSIAVHLDSQTLYPSTVICMMFTIEDLL